MGRKRASRHLFPVRLWGKRWQEGLPTPQNAFGRSRKKRLAKTAARSVTASGFSRLFRQLRQAPTGYRKTSDLAFSLLQETTQRRPFLPSRGASPRSSHDHGARHAFLRPCFPCPHGMKKPVLRGGTPAVNTAPHRAARHVSKTTKAAECRRASSCRLRLWSRRSARPRAPVRDGRRAGPRA